MRVDPFRSAPAKSSCDPFDANQAIPTLLCSPANRSRLNVAVPELRVIQVDWLSPFVYPLSGGFKSWCLIPSQLAMALVRFEDGLPVQVRKFFGFRLFATLQKVANPSSSTPPFRPRVMAPAYATCSTDGAATRSAAASRSRTWRILATTSSPKAVIERSTMS